MELKGRTIGFLGDSITEGSAVEPEQRFTYLIERDCGCEAVHNYGVGGSRIAHQSYPSEKARHDLDFCGRCWNMDPKADIIIVHGGVNDFFHGDAPFGKVGDTKRTTFCGSVDYLCRTIRELYPNAVPVFLAPCHVKGDTDYSSDPNRPPRAEEHHLQEYVDAIMEISPKHGFHAFSMFKEFGFDLSNTYDGIHLNAKGHRAIADTIIRLLESL